jgi:tol-pal system protein YbgF
MITHSLRKRGFFIVGCLVLSSLLITSCVTTQEEGRYLNDQIVAINTRVNKLEESTARKLSSDLDAKLGTIRERQAEVGSEINSLKAENQNISGRLEENAHLVKRAIERDTTEQDRVKANLAGLTQRLADAERRIKLLHEYLKLEPAGEPKKEDIKKEELKKEAPEAKIPAKQPPVPEEKQVSQEEQLYDLTLSAYREEEYEEALAGFKNFLEKFPKSELADNAQFWIAECHMALKQYEQAILAYQDVIKKYPKGNKVPNAMLRQALAFYEIKDKVSSKLLLRRLIKKYPDSSEAKIATQRLKDFK